MDEALFELLNECKKHTGGEPEEALKRACGIFIQQAEKDPLLLKEASENLTSLPYTGASWLAIILGALIERGKDASLTAPAIQALFLSWIEKLPEIKDDETENANIVLNEEQTNIVEALPMLCQSLVAHLARVDTMRNQMSKDENLIEKLENLEVHTHAISWIKELLMKETGSLILLFPEHQAGVKIHYQNVGNCFHLFSLIQHTLGVQLPDGRTPDPKLAATALRQNQEQLHDDAWWHYGNPHSPTPEIVAMIFGEMPVSSIPTINGEQVMLLWKPILGSRGWDSGFFGVPIAAALPQVTLEETLSQEDCQKWFANLNIQVKSKKEKQSWFSKLLR